MTDQIKLWIQNIKAIDPSWEVLVGIICLILGLLSSIWTPYELALKERLRMRPGLPAFDWWLEPPPILLNIHIYNITNDERFLSGEDPELLVEEIGPIAYKEIWKHQNVVFNDNGTMSYFVNRSIVYLKGDNNIDVNATIVVPNTVVLSAMSYLWDLPMLQKLALNSMFDFLGSEPIVKTTIYNFLHNTTDPILDMAHTMLPSLAPVGNAGIINMLYKDFNDNVTVFIGTKNGHQVFSLISEYRGSENIPGQGDSCKNKIRNSSEGFLYNQMITRESILRYYRKPLCKVIPLYYDKVSKVFGITAYKFIMSKDELNRTYPEEDDCFNNYPSLPNGVSDVSPCIYSYPLTVSYVYFNFTDTTLKTCTKIQRPNNKTVQLPHVYVEPVTGIPLLSSAPLQVNLNVRPLRGFGKTFKKFSDKMVPLFWLHYHNTEVPFRVLCLIKIVLILPIIGWILTSMFFAIGMYCIWKSFRRKPLKEHEKYMPSMESNKTTTTELETFLSNNNVG